MFVCICIDAKVRSQRDGDLASDLLSVMVKLNELADRRMEEREQKRMMMKAKLEEIRYENERKHEERMQAMFFGFMQNMMTGFGTGTSSLSSPSLMNSTPFTSQSHLINSFSHPSLSLTSSFPATPCSTISSFPPTACS